MNVNECHEGWQAWCPSGALLWWASCGALIVCSVSISELSRSSALAPCAPTCRSAISSGWSPACPRRRPCRPPCPRCPPSAPRHRRRAARRRAARRRRSAQPQGRRRRKGCRRPGRRRRCRGHSRRQRHKKRLGRATTCLVRSLVSVGYTLLLRFNWLVHYLFGQGRLPAWLLVNVSLASTFPSAVLVLMKLDCNCGYCHPPPCRELLL